MKHVFYSVLFLVSLQSEGQITVEGSYGININDVYDHVSEVNFKKRLSPILLGVSLNKQLTLKSKLKFEFEYSHKGPDLHDINYIVFSPLFNNKFTKHNFLFEIGPYVGYLFNYKLNNRVSNHEALEKFDYGFQFGVGKELNINGNLITVSVQNEIGLYEFSFSKHLIHQLKISAPIQVRPK